MFRIEDYERPDEIDGEDSIVATIAPGDEGQPPIVFGFDRRKAERHPATGQVTAMRCEHETHAYQYPVCSLQLLNQSETGVAAVSDIPMEIDSRVQVSFMPHGGEAAIVLTGHVVRCRPLAGSFNDERTDAPLRGYEIAIAFDPAVAA